MKKYIFYGIIIFIVSILIGYFYGNKFLSNTNLIKDESNVLPKEEKQEEKITEVSSKEIKILPTTKFGMKKKYSLCNHTSFEFVELPIELINKTKEEVEKLYPDWEVEEFYENKVIISKEVDGLCDEHFYITLGEEYIEIYQYTDESNKVLYKRTDITKQYLTQEDIDKLNKGIDIYGKDILNSNLEDFE